MIYYRRVVYYKKRGILRKYPNKGLYTFKHLVKKPNFVGHFYVNLISILNLYTKWFNCKFYYKVLIKLNNYYNNYYKKKRLMYFKLININYLKNVNILNKYKILLYSFKYNNIFINKQRFKKKNNNIYIVIFFFIKLIYIYLYYLLIWWLNILFFKNIIILKNTKILYNNNIILKPKYFMKEFWLYDLFKIYELLSL